MRYFMAILGAFSAFTLAACGGSDDSGTADSDRLPQPTASLTDIAVPCARFDGTAERIAEAQKKLYSGTDAAAAIEALRTELEALKQGAPAEVKKALDTLGEGFQEAAALVAEPGSADPEKFAELSTELSEAGQKVSAYVVDLCR